MNRLDQKFKDLKKKRKSAFIAFLTAGFPDLSATKELVLSFEKAGVDIIELGVPFSDPLADGPTIQAASQYALKKGVTLKKILDLVEDIREQSQIPICLMSYYNPVFCFGEREFVERSVAAGVDGVIIPDLPPEEAKTLIHEARSKHLATIFFLSPTTKKERIALIDQASSGFIYYVSLTGVTGERKTLSKSLIADLKKVCRKTKNPVCVGFGISTAPQVQAISRVADGVIVGSAIIKEINRCLGQKKIIEKVTQYVNQLSLHTKERHYVSKRPTKK